MDSMKELIQPSLCADLQIKWTRLQQDMQLQHADGCLLSVDVNLYYTTAQIFSGYFYLKCLTSALIDLGLFQIPLTNK